MKLTYLGTSSDVGVPAMFCSCRVCEEARRFRGRNIRTRSQAIINDTISLDCSVDTFMHTLYNGLDMRKIQYFLITHSHFDHLFPQNFIGMQKESDSKKMYISKGSSKKLKGFQDLPELNIIKPFVPFEISRYKITPLDAKHSKEIDSVIFMIESKNKSILWAHDTGLFPDSTMNYLKKLDFAFDAISLDCALIRGQQGHDTHMDFDQCVQTASELEQMGRLIRGKSRIFLSHITHWNGLTYQEQVEEAAPYGLEVAYDGLVVNL